MVDVSIFLVLFQNFMNIITQKKTVITQGVVGQVVSLVLVPRLQECNNTIKQCYNTGCSRAGG